MTDTTRLRLSPKERRARILVAALAQAAIHGYRNVTREQIARAADCSDNLVSSYLGTMPELRRDLMRHAIKGQLLDVIAQGIVCKDKIALKAPDDLKQKALAHVARG